MLWVFFLSGYVQRGRVGGREKGSGGVEVVAASVLFSGCGFQGEKGGKKANP